MANDSRRTLHIDLVVDGEGKVIGAMDRVERKGNQAGVATSAAVTALSTGWLAAVSIGQQVIGVIEGVGAEAGRLASESMEAARAQGDLNAALLSTGQNSSTNLEALQNWSLTMQQIADQDADELTSALAKIEHQTNLNADSLDEAGQAAIQVAEIFDVDLKSAAKLVSTAVEGSDRIFKKFGVTVREGATEEERLNALLSITASGMDEAKARAEGFEGKVNLLKRSWGDLREEIGGFLFTDNPFLIDAFGDISGTIVTLTEKISGLGDEGDSVGMQLQQGLGAALLQLQVTALETGATIESSYNQLTYMDRKSRENSKPYSWTNLLIPGSAKGIGALQELITEEFNGGVRSVPDNTIFTQELIDKAKLDLLDMQTKQGPNLPRFAQSQDATISGNPDDLLDADSKKERIKKAAKAKASAMLEGWHEGIAGASEYDQRTLEFFIFGNMYDGSQIPKLGGALDATGRRLPGPLSMEEKIAGMSPSVAFPPYEHYFGPGQSSYQRKLGKLKDQWGDYFGNNGAFFEDDNLLQLLGAAQDGGLKGLLGGIGGGVFGAPGAWLGRKLGGLFGGGGDRRAERGTRENPMITRNFEEEDLLNKILNITRGQQVIQQGAYFNGLGDQLRAVQGLTPGRA